MKNEKREYMSIEQLIGVIAIFLLIVAMIESYMAKDVVTFKGEIEYPMTDTKRQNELTQDYINFKYGIEENPEENPFYWFEVKEGVP